MSAENAVRDDERPEDERGYHYFEKGQMHRYLVPCDGKVVRVRQLSETEYLSIEGVLQQQVNSDFDWLVECEGAEKAFTSSVVQEINIDKAGNHGDLITIYLI